MAWIEFYNSLHCFTPFRIGDPNHGTVLHGWVAPDDLLDSSWVDVEATRDDHVLFTICEMQIALRIDMADIPRVQPAINDGFSRLIRGLIIALHDEIAPDADFSSFTAGKDAVLIVHNFNPH